jgi:5-deoxy-glucuronate isomerase
MSDLVRKSEKRPIVDAQSGPLKRTYFNLVKLTPGETYRARVDGFETLYVVQSGQCDIDVAGTRFDAVGGRADIWSGKADSVYATAGAEVCVRAGNGGAELAVAGGVCSEKFPPFRVRPDEVEVVDVGSQETHSHRRIFHLLGQNGQGRAGNLLVSELYADAGCWSGYPPHKHDEDVGTSETNHEEVYHYRYRPDNGFGAQLCFQPDGSAKGFMTRSGDTFILDRGYHPTVTSPGHEAYVFTILVGASQRGLVQNFKEEYRYLMRAIPGVADMVDKFK